MLLQHLLDDGGVYEASSEQVEIRAPVHRALDQLEVVHLPFHLAVAPTKEQCGEHRIVIATHPCREGMELRACGGGEPGSEYIRVVRREHVHKGRGGPARLCEGGQAAGEPAERDKLSRKAATNDLQGYLTDLRKMLNKPSDATGARLSV